MTACPDRETLKLMLADSPEAERRRTIAWHVQGCPSCQSALSELAATAPEVTSTPGTEPLPPLDNGAGEGTPSTDAVLPAVPGYEVGAELGRGGMGLVLRGRDLSLNREVAIKVLLPQYQDAPELARRFVEEAQVCSQLQHPGIPPIHELGTLPDGRPFFAMKRVKGTTLARLLAERRDPSQDLPHFVGVFGQVCQALAFAHSKGVIHRDLKPANVMVGGFGEVQVMDWGLAKVLQPGAARPASEERAAGSVIESVRT